MRVLVCGAAGGIGAACVTMAERAGHRVAGVDRPDAVPGLTALDITVPGGAEQAVAHAVETLGGLDGVVHAVGMSGRRLGDGPVSTCTDQAWAEVLRVNLESAFRLLRAALPVLAGGDGGSIVIVGSALARTLDRDFLTAAYAISKAAVEALVRLAAFEGAASGVRVNVVAPALVDTPMAARALTNAGVAARLPELRPGRHCRGGGGGGGLAALAGLRADHRRSDPDRRRMDPAMSPALAGGAPRSPQVRRNCGVKPQL
jgi:NAD(P)-dependent dehydrogenase (short-subunit alcohol dehydrogenase family)